MAARRLRPDLTTPTRRALLAGAAACMAAPVRATALPLPQPDGDWTPFDDSDGSIRFKGAVNGEPVDLTLDTGAGRVVVDQAFARQIGLDAVSARGTLRGLAESRPGGLTGPLVIKVGHGELSLPNAALADLSPLKAVGYGAPVLIGRDIFELAAVDIDFVGKRLAFRERGSFDTSAFRRVRMRARKDVPEIEVSIESARPVWAVLDLGSNSALQMSKAFADRVGLFDGRRTSAWVSTGIDGVTTYDVGRTSHLTVAGVTLRGVRFDAYPVWNRSSPSPVNIGYPIVRQLGRIILDYKSDSLFVSRNAPPPAPFAGDRVGLALMPLASGFEVVFVAPGSPADRAGWKAGERIAAINGKPVMPRTERATLGNMPRIAFTLADGTVRELAPANYY
jgi:hypothetical protein